LQNCRKENLHTALDTSGAVPLAVCCELIDAADLILLDIKGVDAQSAERLAGNPRCFENSVEILDHCRKTNKPVWIRHVLLRDLTCTEENLTKLAELLAPYSNIEKVDLLPFHTMGFFKWENLKLTNPLADSNALTPEEKSFADKVFTQAYNSRRK
jgi:pyruvate formate lyase activating enzyme